MSDLSERMRLDSFRFALEESRSHGCLDTDLALMAYERADRVVALAPGREAWACGKGCAACCHLKVHVTRPEVALIAAHLDTVLSEDEREALRATVKARAQAGADLDPGAWRRAALPCALLAEDGTCRVYDVRPVPCRIHTSPAVRACEDPDAVVALDRWLVLVGQALQRGLDPDSPRELHDALLHSS